MIVQCSYCKLILGEKPPIADTRVSHSVCEKCFEQFMIQIEKSKPKKVA
jgi:hypothetical protein